MSYGTLISTVTVGAGGAANITFSSIPQTYTDLLLVVSGRTINASVYDTYLVTFNGVSTNQSSRYFFGTGSSVANGNPTTIIGGQWTAANATANTFGSSQLYIPNYAGSTNKAVSIDDVHETNATTAYQQLTAGLWASTAAITSITLAASNTVAQYSTASLYGIK